MKFNRRKLDVSSQFYGLETHQMSRPRLSPVTEVQFLFCPTLVLSIKQSGNVLPFKNCATSPLRTVFLKQEKEEGGGRRDKWQGNWSPSPHTTCAQI